LAANKLVVNVDKTNIMKFIMNWSHITLRIGCKENYIAETVNTKFIGYSVITT